MKTLLLSLTALALAVFLCGSVHAQSPSPEKKVSISYNWIRIPGSGSNQLAIWVEDTKGNYVNTIYATRYTATGGYVRRPVSLSDWTAKSDWKSATKEEVDAVSGSTPQTGPQTVTWNGKDKSGKVVPNGTYVVRMEANIHDADKMFYKAEVKIGGANQKPAGEVTYSSPALATGNVLFKDVVVEYK